MKENKIIEIINYMKEYVENKYEHNEKPLLNWKDLKMIIDEIENKNKIINNLKEELKNIYINIEEYNEEYTEKCIEKIIKGGKK